MMPAIPTFSLLQGLDGVANAAPETPVGTDLFSALVECLGEAPSPAAAAVGAPLPDTIAPADNIALLAIRPSLATPPTDQTPPEEGEPEPGERERQEGEPPFPQAALVAVLAAQLPVSPAIAVPLATAANAAKLPVDTPEALPGSASSSRGAAEVATPPGRQAEASTPQLPQLPAGLVTELVKTTHGPNRPQDRAAHAAAPATAQQAAAVPATEQGAAVPAPGTLAPSVPVLATVLAQPALAVEAPAAAPDQMPVPVLAEQQVERQLDLARESEWLDSLARDIVRMGEKGGALRFRLHPESLGSLAVEISHGAAGASVRLTADSEAARAIIVDAQPRLMAEARAQGVRIAETHVDLGSGGHAAPEDRRGRNGAAEEILVRTSGGEAADKAPSPPAVRDLAERYA